MALISCSECTREISSQADKCPHCGAPVAPLARGCVELFSRILGAVIAFGLVFYLVRGWLSH
jgi:predicted amidophosphoribosyltransferase